jgi:Holliday junction resolvase RusA-like endonuclease
MWELRAPVEPVPQCRPRFHTFTGNNGKLITNAYDPAGMKKYKEDLAWYFEAQLRGRKIIEKEPVAVVVEFWFSPTAAEKKKSTFAKVHVKNKDIDNLVKAVFDAANKSVWHDDQFVFAMFALKMICGLDQRPHVALKIFKEDELAGFISEVQALTMYADSTLSEGLPF